MTRQLTIWKDKDCELTSKYNVAILDTRLDLPVYFVFKIDIDCPDVGKLTYDKRSIKLFRFRILKSPLLEMSVTGLTQPIKFCILEKPDMDWLEGAIEKMISKTYLEGLKKIREEEDANNLSLHGLPPEKRPRKTHS